MINANDAIEDLVTMGDLVRWGASCFNEAELDFGHGTDNAMDDSFALVCHALHLPHDIPSYMVLTNLTKNERRRVVNLLMERISTRKPTPYLTHQAWFAGLSFYVDERVLVPRSPFAELIEHAFVPWVDPDGVESILDLCTGSGCIAIASAMEFPEAKIVATDVYADALDVAAFNIEKYGLKSQVELVQSDLFDALDAQNQFDLIVSNPPYVDARDMAALTPEFQQEPPHALAAGKDGLDVVKRILKEAPRYLSEHGVLMVEVGNSSQALIEQFPDVPFSWPEFEKGGHGVFVLTRQELVDARL